MSQLPMFREKLKSGHTWCIECGVGQSQHGSGICPNCREKECDVCGKRFVASKLGLYRYYCAEHKHLANARKVCGAFAI